MSDDIGQLGGGMALLSGTPAIEVTVDSPANSREQPILAFTPFSSTYKRFLDDTDWRDPHEVAGWRATWPGFAGPLGTPIDHIFVSNDIDLHSYTTRDSFGSDHQTLTASVSMPGTG